MILFHISNLDQLGPVSPQLRLGVVNMLLFSIFLKLTDHLQYSHYLG